MKHNDINVARATIADIDTILKWRRKALAEENPQASEQDMDRLIRETRRYLYDAMPGRKYEACIAHSYCGMLGCGGMTIYSVLPTSRNPKGLCAIVENVCVADDLRGQGIEERIVSWLEHEARSRGAEVVKYVEAPIEKISEEIAV